MNKVLGRRNIMRERHRQWGKIDHSKVNFSKLKLSLEKEVEREKLKGFWGWIKSFFVMTKAEKKLRLFKNLYPHAK